jgi:hypothetical protein
VDGFYKRRSQATILLSLARADCGRKGGLLPSEQRGVTTGVTKFGMRGAPLGRRAALLAQGWQRFFVAEVLRDPILSDANDVPLSGVHVSKVRKVRT